MAGGRGSGAVEVVLLVVLSLLFIDGMPGNVACWYIVTTAAHGGSWSWCYGGGGIGVVVVFVDGTGQALLFIIAVHHDIFLLGALKKSY